MALATGLKGIYELEQSAVVTDSIPDLDSFSESAVAVAALRRHTRELSDAYARDFPVLERESKIRFARQARQNEDRGNRSAEWIAQLKSELRQREALLSDGDLRHRLLLLYMTQARWEPFVDCYLSLLRFSPNHPDVYHWARLALRHSLDCGRTEEVLDALQHIARFQRDSDVVARVKLALERWQTESGTNRLSHVP